MLNGLERIVRAINLQEVDRTPVWFMRQAGRYLPEYRALKARYDFRTMVQTPDLAAEVTLQPIKRFPLIDAAIVFSDILVIPEALGMPYHFRDQGGISMDWKLERKEDMARLSTSAIEEKLDYVFQTLNLCRAELGGRKALLGFGGSPWTLATYMVEGGSSEDFLRIKRLGFENPSLLNHLLQCITEALTAYFERMADCGVQAIQIFDSWGSSCPGHLYEAWSLSWIRHLIKNLDGKVPVILFSKGMGAHLEAWKETGAQVFSLDPTIDLQSWAQYPQRRFALQGNLDPVLLCCEPAVVKQAVLDILVEDRVIPGHIFNLGHGIMPEARIESVETMLETVDSVRNRQFPDSGSA
jgi:uroporphyrinogen decarboxylase